MRSIVCKERNVDMVLLKMLQCSLLKLHLEFSSNGPSIFVSGKPLKRFRLQLS